MYIYVYLSAVCVYHLSICLPVCLSVFLSACLSACLSVCLPVCLSVCAVCSLCACVCVWGGVVGCVYDCGTCVLLLGRAACMYIYMYIYICICIYIYVYIYTYMYMDGVCRTHCAVCGHVLYVCCAAVCVCVRVCACVCVCCVAVRACVVRVTDRDTQTDRHMDRHTDTHTDTCPVDRRSLSALSVFCRSVSVFCVPAAPCPPLILSVWLSPPACVAFVLLWVPPLTVQCHLSWNRLALVSFLF